MYSCVLFEADSEMEVAHKRSSNTVISQARSGRPANYVSPGGPLVIVAYDSTSGAHSGEKGAMSYFTHANLGTRVRVTCSWTNHRRLCEADREPTLVLRVRI